MHWQPPLGYPVSHGRLHKAFSYFPGGHIPVVRNQEYKCLYGTVITDADIKPIWKISMDFASCFLVLKNRNAMLRHFHVEGKNNLLTHHNLVHLITGGILRTLWQFRDPMRFDRLFSRQVVTPCPDCPPRLKPIFSGCSGFFASCPLLEGRQE